MKVNKQLLNEIYDKETNEFIKFLTNYKNEEITPSEEWENITEMEKSKIDALNSACKDIFEIITSEEINLAFADIDNIIDKSKLNKDDKNYPNEKK